MMLETMGCTSIAKFFICSLVTPKPLEIIGAAPPCRSICGSIQKSCRNLLDMLMSIPQGSCKDDVVGAKYRDTISKTRSGIQCQKWNLQEPHLHKHTPQNHPDEDLSENYCRNPDREPYGPWCYTTDMQRRWDYCDIPLCKCRFNLRCDLFPANGCMELKAKDDSGEFELKLKGQPKLTDLLKFDTETLPLLKKALGTA